MGKMDQWKGRVALVTGASSGIGQAVATRLAQEGMQVFGCARRTERLARLEQQLASMPGSFVGVTADLQKEDDIAALFATIRDQTDGVDVLINNAGLGYRSPLMEGETAAWREMLSVNVLALCICTREAISDMRSRGDSGHIIHISSMSGHRVPAGSGVYSATKFAVRSLTEGLRQELRAAHSAIRVTAISPGFVETEFAENYHGSAEEAARVYSRYPVIQSAELADAVIYALCQPPHVEIHDVLLRPTAQPS